MPPAAPLLAARRRELIVEAARSGRGAGVADLARRFNVSEMTVRRDLAHLAREGKVVRVHGGAVSEWREPPFAEIAVERLEAKQRIGTAAAALVEDGQTIMIDIGTTTLQLAEALHGREVTVITSSLAVMEELLPDDGIELICLGGVVRRNYRSLVGVLAEDALRQFRGDIAFLGASGIDAENLSVFDSTIVEVPIKRAMIAAAARSILVADAEKFSMRGVIRVCGADDLDALVTDADYDAGPDRFADAGIEVVRA